MEDSRKDDFKIRKARLFFVGKLRTLLKLKANIRHKESMPENTSFVTIEVTILKEDKNNTSIHLYESKKKLQNDSNDAYSRFIFFLVCDLFISF